MKLARTYNRESSARIGQTIVPVSDPFRPTARPDHMAIIARFPDGQELVVYDDEWEPSPKLTRLCFCQARADLVQQTITEAGWIGLCDDGTALLGPSDTAVLALAAKAGVEIPETLKHEYC